MLLSMLLLCFLRVSQMRYGTAAGDQFGTPWARILLGFRCFASMPHGCVHRPCPPVMHLQMSPCPPCAYYTHAFAVFLRVSKMLYGTALGINLACLGLEFCWGSAVSQACLTDAFIGHVHLLRAYIICSAIRHAPIYMSMLLLCFYGFRRCCTAPPLGINLARLGLECCWGSAVAQACLTDAFIGYVRLYAPICPSISAMMRLYPPTPRQARGGGAWEGQCQSMTFSFLEKANLYASMPKIEFETKDKTKDSIVTPGGLGILLKCCTAPPLRMHLPRLGLEFCWGSTVLQACFTDGFIGHVHLPCAYMSSSPPCAYYMHAFALCLRVSKMLYGTASGDQFGTPWARILLGFRCFASLPHGRAHRPAMSTYVPICPAIRHARIYPCFCPCFCCVFTGFEDAVRHRLWG